MQQPPNQEYPQQQWQQQNTSWGSAPQWQQYEPLPPKYPQQIVPQQHQWQQQPFSPQQNTPPPNGLHQSPVRPSLTLSRITWILVGVAIGLIFGLILGSSYGKSATTTSSVITTQDTAQQTSQPILAPTQPAITPAPTHTSTWITTQTFTGNGAKKTGFFTVPDNWKLVWKCNPSSSYGDEYNVQIFVYGSDNSLVDLAVNTICNLEQCYATTTKPISAIPITSLATTTNATTTASVSTAAVSTDRLISRGSAVPALPE